VVKSEGIVEQRRDADNAWSVIGRAGAILDNLIAAGKAVPRRTRGTAPVGLRGIFPSSITGPLMIKDAIVRGCTQKSSYSTDDAQVIDSSHHWN
jgi:hypothetical protein